MSTKIEGTIVLEGLVEGPAPPFPDAQEKLEKWGRGFAGGAVRMSVQVDGGHFSAMPSNEPHQSRALAQEGGDPSATIADSLSELLRFFPPLERTQVFSTIRSVEYRPDLEVQTLYAVGPDGRAVTRQQSVPCKTVSAEQPVSGREILHRGAIGLLVAAVILLASSFFVDYPALWRQLTSGVTPVKTTVDRGMFSPYFRLEVMGLDQRTGILKLRVTRTAVYPRDEAAFDALYENPPQPVVPAAASMPATAPQSAASLPATAVAEINMSLLRRRLAVASLAKGDVRLIFRDAGGQILGMAFLAVSELQSHETLETGAPGPVINKQLIAPASIEVVPD